MISFGTEVQFIIAQFVALMVRWQKLTDIWRFYRHLYQHCILTSKAAKRSQPLGNPLGIWSVFHEVVASLQHDAKMEKAKREKRSSTYDYHICDHGNEFDIFPGKFRCSNTCQDDSRSSDVDTMYPSRWWDTVL